MNRMTAKPGIAFLLTFFITGISQAAVPVSLDELLDQVRSGRIKVAHRADPPCSPCEGWGRGGPMSNV